MITVTNDSSVLEHMRAHSRVQSRSTAFNFNQPTNYELIKIC